MYEDIKREVDEVVCVFVEVEKDEVEVNLMFARVR